MLSNFKDKEIFFCVDSDLDGLSSRLIAEYYVKPIVKNFSLINTAKRDMSEFDYDLADKAEVIVFIDITPSLDLYHDYLKDSGKELYIFDHHISAYEDLKEFNLPNYIFDTERCGCKIFFESLTEGQRVKRSIYQFVELCNCYDTWNMQSSLWQDARNLSNLMYEYVDWSKEESDTIRYRDFIKSMLYKFDNHNKFMFSDYEKIMIQKAIQKENRRYKEAVSSLQVRQDNDNNTYLYIEAVSKLSYVANRLLQEYPPGVKYIIAHSNYEEKYKNKENGKISIRSKGDFDVSIIASKWGGGGHVAAAGIELSIEDFTQLKKGEIHLI